MVMTGLLFIQKVEKAVFTILKKNSSKIAYFGLIQKCTSPVQNVLYAHFPDLSSSQPPLCCRKLEAATVQWDNAVTWTKRKMSIGETAIHLLIKLFSWSVSGFWFCILPREELSIDTTYSTGVPWEYILPLLLEFR